MAALGAVLGHCHSIWLKGKGGKGVATGLGVLLAAMWPVGIACCVIWLVMARLMRFSSVAALAALAAAPVLIWLAGDVFGAVITLLIAIQIAVRHRANIARLLAGTEPRIGAEVLSLNRLRLARTEGVGPVAYRRLLARFGTAGAALDALPGMARNGGRIGMELASADAARREVEQVRKLGGRLIFLDDSDYPKILALLDDAPPGHRRLWRCGRALANAPWRWWAAATLPPMASASPKLWRPIWPRPGWSSSPASRAGSTRRRIRARCAPAAQWPASPAGSTRPTPPRTPPCRPGLPKAGPWWPRPPLEPRPRHAISRAATGSSPACRWAWWWLRRRCAQAA